MQPTAGPQYGQDPTSAPQMQSAARQGAGPAAPMGQQMEHPLRPVVTMWLEKIKLASEFKMAEFGKDAIDCMRFFDGPYDFLYNKQYANSDASFKIDEGEGQEFPAPTFKMTLNKVAELVQIFGPVLYHKNPYRQVNPRQVPLPPLGVMNPGGLGVPAPNMAAPGTVAPGGAPGGASPGPDPYTMQLELLAQQSVAQDQAKDKARAQYLEWYLNYTPTELDLKTEMRTAIDEALIKGMSCLWVELYQPKGSNIRLVGTFWDSVDNLVVDPDMEGLAHANWIARKCVHPVWKVEDDYKLPRGSLKGNLESYNAQAATNADADGDYNRKRGLTNDLLVYWKVYSKMGIGGRLTGMDSEMAPVLEQFGDNVFLVLAEGTPYPLNLPPDLIAAPGGQSEIMNRVQWETPFWADDAWPMHPVIFHPRPKKLWPMSHLKPALGQLKFLNWVYSFIASKIRVTCRDFLVCKKSLGEEIMDILLHGNDLTLIPLEEVNGKIDEIVAFLQHPEFNGDIWKVIDAVVDSFEKSTGLSELIYGQSGKQMRSAEEASLRSDQLSVRPDDMANKVEDAASAIARMEALAIRWHLQPQDVQPLLGDVGALYWQMLVMTTDIYALTRQLEYRIEAGTTKKPNLERDASNLHDAMQVLFAPLFKYAESTGNVGPINALISDWARSVGMDASKYLLSPPPPPPPLPGPPAPHIHVHQGGPPGGAGGASPPAGGGPPPGGRTAAAPPGPQIPETGPAPAPPPAMAA